jgi:hypothetical protein
MAFIVPTIHEVESILKDLFNSEYKIKNQKEDSDGILIELDAIAPDPDEDNKGGQIEYSYIRNACPNNKELAKGVINSIVYNKYEFPISGSSVAKFNGEEWRMTP